MTENETVGDWAARLQAFTHRNAGRRTVLEEEDPAGTARGGTDYPLWGVSWDPRDGRIQIMMGEQGSVEEHVTRTIPAASGIELERGPDGRDQALRIIHDGGRTLLRFVKDPRNSRVQSR